MDTPGKLYIVSTPIGNLADITFRAIEILKGVDAILCEDTRHTKKLLDHYEIHASLQSFHAHSGEGREEGILAALRDGKRYALVSDAGTPLISDPGGILISKILKELGSGYVEVIPGASALVSALVRSGFPSNIFTFLGFVPAKKGRESFFRELDSKEETVVFYESTHKIIKTFESLVKMLGNRPIALVREITKMYEETISGTASEILQILITFPEKTKGEHVVVIAPKKYKITD